ncbi:MAG: DUF4282 domain-containing protein [Pseudonocardiales bacterium]|nr:DUF4282 domain-containing protein [Pseudonocardiales bacterium]
MTYNLPPSGPPGPQYPEGTGGPPSGWQSQSHVPGFFGALFDFSFNHFVTPLIIRVLYILGLIGIALYYLGFVVFGFLVSAVQGILILLFGLIIAFAFLALWRVILEFYLAVIRMSEDIHHRGLPGGR